MNTNIKYRPKSIDELIFADSQTEAIVKKYSSGQTTRPLILYGPYGSGKSLISELIPKAIDGPAVSVEKHRAQDIASPEKLSKTIRSKTQFEKFFKPAYQSRFHTLFDDWNGEVKMDHQSIREAIDDIVDGNMIIFTTNELEKMDPGIRSRAEQVFVDTLKPEQFFTRSKDILQKEGVMIDDAALLSALQATYNRYRDNRKYYETLDNIIYRARNP